MGSPDVRHEILFPIAVQRASSTRTGSFSTLRPSARPPVHPIGWSQTDPPGLVRTHRGPGRLTADERTVQPVPPRHGGLPEQQPCNESAAQSFEAIRHGNRVILAIANGYLSLDKGGPGGRDERPGGKCDAVQDELPLNVRPLQP